jgi:Pvc16 N-terminal domain
MSNPLAIAAVTATLRQMLTSTSGGLTANLPSDLPTALNMDSVSVTTKPPDKARDPNNKANQVNIYLYQTVPNAAYRNMDLPRQTRPGEIAQPPVALTLHYLLSAYGHNDEDTAAHILLGQAMRIFHDNAVLGREAIRTALNGNDLHEQLERVRISPLSLTTEEISKLWAAFQTQYRLSAAYQAEVVLIESTQSSRAGLPVLQRGEGDRGPSATAGDTVPILEEVRLPNRQSSALLGDELTVIGQNLGNASAVRFTLVNSRLAIAPTISLPAAAIERTEKGIKVTLPDDAAAHTTWIAGFYALAVLVDSVVNGKPQTWSSNELPISLAPRVEKIEPANQVARDGNGNVTLTLTCKPEVKLAVVDAAHMRFDQRVMLLLGTVRQIAPQAPPAPPLLPAPPPQSTDKLTFVFPVSADEVGEYLVRLRVDGVDLPLVDRTASPPQFHPSQKVTIT